VQGIAQRSKGVLISPKAEYLFAFRIIVEDESRGLFYTAAFSLSSENIFKGTEDIVKIDPAMAVVIRG
jgi:hypothetical protein